MDGVYFIENTVNECDTCIRGYFSSLDDAKKALQSCSNWYESKGTGKIYFVKFGLKENPKLVYRN